MVNEKTSIIIPVFNGEKTLERALKSILNQNIKPDEVLIINDASIDKTNSIVENWLDKLPINYHTNKFNMGVSYSLRKGILLSKGEIILRLDADDEWGKDHLKSLLYLIEKNKNSKLFASMAEYIEVDNNNIKSSEVLSDENIREKLLWDNPIVHSSIAFFKEDYLKTNGYCNYKIAHDYSLYLELLKQGELSFHKQTTVKYYIYSNSLSRNRAKNLSRKERYLNQLKAIYFFGKRYKIKSSLILPIILIRLILNLPIKYFYHNLKKIIKNRVF